MPSDAAPSNRLTAEQLADLLTQVGGDPVDAADVHQDFHNGAPADENGTVDLLQYAAWLAGQEAGGK